MSKIVVVAFALIYLSCQQNKVDKKAEGEKVMQLSREWSQAAATGDVNKVLDYWAEDAIVMSAGDPVHTGKAAIRKMVEYGFKMPGFRISWEPKSVVVSESGDMAYIIEDSQISYNDSTGKPMTMHNKAVSIWRKQSDGNWKNAVDISTPAETSR